ncbi:MAG TPA: lysophospholipid acyltransferase family protein [Clostridia bacterium]|nr:lysophospholipid acyltransferase family protein [Clostridia bacterium]
MLYIFAKVFLKWIMALVLRPFVLHRENLRSKGKVIFVCNHVAMPDPIAIALVSNRVIHFMAKAELFESRVSRLFYDSLLVFPVSPASADLKSIKKAINLLNKGKAFGMFPEGHRSATQFDMDIMHRGAAYIATRADAPIIPIYLDPHSWDKGHRIRMAVGEAIVPSKVREQVTSMKYVNAVTDRIADAFNSLREELGSA